MLTKAAKWIECGKEFSAPFILKTFVLGEAAEFAEISVCGLGYYELFINGARVGEEYFKPAFSDYCERDFSSLLYPLPDRTSHTVYYNSYDVAPLLREGKNVLALLLGNGFYRQTRRTVEGKVWFSEKLIACFDLSVRGGGRVRHIRSDGTERVFASFIAENNLFYGETHDYSSFRPELLRQGAEEGEGVPVRVVSPPCRHIEEQKCPNDAIARTIHPKFLRERGGRRLYDAGENIAGFVVLESAGDTLTVRHAENLTEEGELDFLSAGGAGQISVARYIGAPAGSAVHPWFSWSGFRYFEVEGNARGVYVAVVHTAVQPAAGFSCGNGNVQWLFDAFSRTMLNNMHGGVPSDCPHRERLGYTGDGQLTAESAMLLFGCCSFYEKWMRDIADCQDAATGHIQHTAPFCGGGGGPGGWGGAAVLIPYYHYKLYADKRFVRRYLGTMRRFLSCMHGFCENGLVVREREGGWCLGEWCTPEPISLPEPFVNTYYYIKCLRAAQYLIGECGEAADYSAEIHSCEEALVREYFDESSGSFCGGGQGADAFAVSLGLGDARTEQNLYRRCSDLGKFETGIFGTDVLCGILAEKRPDLLLRLLSAEEFPSFGFMRRSGATTLWEDWDGRASHDHPMFGACVRQLFYGLAGIRFGFGRGVEICPPYLPELGFIRVDLRVGRGEISAKIGYMPGGVRLRVCARGITAVIRGYKGEIIAKVRGEREVFLPAQESVEKV